MYELASVGELPLPRASPPATNKRDRDADSTTDTSPGPDSSTASSPASLADEARHIAGSRRVSAAARPLHSQQAMQGMVQMQDAFAAGPSNAVGNLEGSSTAATLNVAGSIPPTATANLTQMPPSSAFPGPLGGWYGYDGADAQPAPATASTAYGSANATAAAQSSAHGAATAATASQPFQPLDVGHMFTTQSMMYDQVLSNLSASLGQPPGEPVQYAQPHEARQPRMSPDSTYVSSDTVFEELLASFGEDYAAMFPDFNTNGTLGFSTWPNNMDGGQQGFG